MSTPLVSIIVPCFRQAHFLPQAIESALAQSLNEVEVIVVNDGSDDNTDEVCRRYGNRIIYIAQHNQGLPTARNNAIAVARGRYIHCLDADDVIHPDAMAAMVTAMEDRDDRMVIVEYGMFNETIDTLHYRKRFPERDEPFPWLIHHNFGPPVILLSSRKMVLAAGGFNPRLRACEDYDMWIRLALDGADLVIVQRLLAFYRTVPGSMSTNHMRMLDTRTQVFLSMYDRMKERADLWQALGADLLLAAHRVRRRWVLHDSRSPFIAMLTKCIKQLEAAGFILPRSSWRRYADRRLGIWSDRLVLKYMKWLRPEVYQQFRESHN